MKFNVLYLLLILFPNITLIAQIRNIPVYGLVAYYPFDGSANDSSENKRHGVLVNNPTFVPDIMGIENSACKLDGIDDRIDLGNWFNYQDFSISMWIKKDAAAQSEYANIIDNNHTGARSWVVQYSNTANSFYFGTINMEKVINFDLPTDEWKHYVFIHSASNSFVYENGKLISSVLNLGSILYDGTEFLRIGAWGANLSRNFNGTIDEVRIYNRILQENEISILSEQLKPGVSNLPLVIINTNGQEIPDEPKITAQMKVINNASGINTIDDKTTEYNEKIEIELRGSTSQLFEKKSYSLETIYDKDSSINVSLMGLPKENDWVLYAPYSDKSLIRNALAYHLGNLTGHWTPRTKFCELYLNNEYRGVYVLVEKIKRNKNRVDISSLKADKKTGDDLTGGYIVKIDRPDEGAWTSPFPGINGKGEIKFSYVEPKFAKMPEEQRNYIKNYITDFEKALKSDKFKDPATGYRAYIDVNSFIDFYLINELSKNIDAYRLSTFLYKDKNSKDGKLKMGPLWDFDLAFGNADYYDGFNTSGWINQAIDPGDDFQEPFWWNRLREDPYFESSLKKRWNELRSNKLSNKNINAFIDSCSFLLAGAQTRNFHKYKILNTYVWPNPYIKPTYNSEINTLKNWIYNRLIWMDKQIESFKIIKKNQAITFEALLNKKIGDPPFDLKATASSNLDVTFASDNEAVASITGTKLTVLKAGKVTITASQAGNADWNAAEPVTQTLTITKKAQTITFEAIPAKKTNDDPFTLNASPASNLPVTFASSDTLIASVAESTLTIHKAGTVTITATQAGNEEWEPISASQKLTISAITGINDKKEEDNLFIYPNPVTETLYINGKGFENVSIFNALGANVWNGNLAGQSINVSQLPAGIYLLRISNKNEVKTIRFQKQ